MEKEEENAKEEEEEERGGRPPGTGGKSINKRRSLATQLAASSCSSSFSWPDFVLLLGLLFSLFPLVLLPLPAVLLLSPAALDIQTNKLGGPLGPGPRMNHLKQWNAD